MDLKSGKRVSAKEAAAILGVPYQNISRIDRACTVIQRFRLGHKTYVYDLDSLYRFLASCQSKPSRKMDAGVSAGRSNASLKKRVSEKQSSSLQDFLRAKLTS
ncbi:putative phage integrase domain protein [Burkholderia cepacia]|nr:putative phage integrase domain protein [Burkholderia cepacia]KGC02484.1 putative phage integrase domain protein [Burkholderia cepacia]